MKSDLESLASLLRESRDRLGLTLREVEAKVGISNAYLSQLEGAKKRTPLWSRCWFRHLPKAGFVVVMIHEPTDRQRRKSDPLAAYALRSLRRDCDITAAVIHTATGTECYEQPTNGGAPSAYRLRGDKRGKHDGYLRNVALNKVLLTNEKWPFVLAQRTHADLTIDVDVKSHFAGSIAVGHGGDREDIKLRLL